MSVQNGSSEYPHARKIRDAVVGASWISQEDFMPGVEHTGNSKIAALVTGDQKKRKMARTEEGCSDMIEAGARMGAKLMIAYRLHFDEATIEAIETVHSGRIGDPRFFSKELVGATAPGGN